MQPLTIGEDRGMIVPAGRCVVTEYVSIWTCMLASRDRMSPADVEKAMQRRMAAAPGQPWPCPVGKWQAGRFVIYDGRHEYLAAVMLGVEHILVAHIEIDAYATRGGANDPGIQGV
jgi:hypothetical protein